MYIAEKVNITDSFEPDEEIVNHVKLHADKINEELDKLALCSQVSLEARFSRVRTEETNLGNMVVDIMRSHYNSDIGLMQGGSLRANL